MLRLGMHFLPRKLDLAARAHWYRREREKRKWRQGREENGKLVSGGSKVGRHLLSDHCPLARTLHLKWPVNSHSENLHTCKFPFLPRVEMGPEEFRASMSPLHKILLLKARTTRGVRGGPIQFMVCVPLYFSIVILMKVYCHCPAGLGP